MLSLTFSVAALMLSLAAPALAAPPTFAETADMRDLPGRWRPLMDEFSVPGMAIAVVKDGRLHAAEGFGTRDGDPAHGVTTDTMFYMASITKTCNAFGICMLAEQGKLSLDDSVRKHLPRFRLADDSAERIAIRDLLCHRIGLNAGPVVTLDAYTGEITEDRYYAWLAESNPRGEVAYTNVHYTLLGRVMEAAGGLSWRDYLERELFVPAGMTRTTGYASRMYGDANAAVPMERRPDGSWAKAGRVKTDEVMHAAGGLGTTASDGARWIMLNVGDGEIEGRRLLSARGARQMRELHAEFPKPRGSYRINRGFGLGWQVGTYAGRPLCDHGGGYIGTSAYVAILPDQKAGFFVLMNASGPAQGLGDIIAIDLLNRLTGEDLAPGLLDSYRKRLADQRARAAPAPAPDRPITAALLSAPLESYAGDYVNPLLGTIRVTAGEDRLHLALGQCALQVEAKDKDGFNITGPILEQTGGAFSPPRDGRILRVTLTRSDEGRAFVFERR